MQSYRYRQERAGTSNRRTSRATGVTLVAAALLAPITARAADLDTARGPITAPAATPDEANLSVIDRAFATLHGWNVVVGAGAVVRPEYEGSDKFSVLPIPLISASYHDWLHLDTRGATIDIFEYSGFNVALRGGYELGRKEDDSDYLRGMGDIDMGGVLGGIVSYKAGPFKIYAGVDKTIGASDGLTGSLGASASHRYDRFLFSADAYATFADDKYMEAYFGVNANQSARSGLSQYEAKAGVKRVDLKASVTYMVTPNWLVTGSAGVGLLTGDAKDSPLVKDEVQPFAMLGVSYRF